MRAGDLRHRVTFQAKTATEDSFGEQLPTWIDQFTVSAAIEPLSGRELFAAQSVQSEVTHQITVRYRSEFASPRAIAAMRIAYGNRLFDVHAVMNVDERNRMVIVMASEGLNDG